MQETMDSFKPLAEESGLCLTMAIGAKVPSQIQCDRKRLRQLIENLLFNAIKFTDDGDVAVEVDRDPISAYLGQEKPGDDDHGSNGHGDYLFFSVRDSGIGISRDKQEIIFNPFSQVDGIEQPQLRRDRPRLGDLQAPGGVDGRKNRSGE